MTLPLVLASPLTIIDFAIFLHCNTNTSLAHKYQAICQLSVEVLILKIGPQINSLHALCGYICFIVIPTMIFGYYQTFKPPVFNYKMKCFG